MLLIFFTYSFVSFVNEASVIRAGFATKPDAEHDIYGLYFVVQNIFARNDPKSAHVHLS